VLGPLDAGIVVSATVVRAIEQALLGVPYQPLAFTLSVHHRRRFACSPGSAWIVLNPALPREGTAAVPAERDASRPATFLRAGRSRRSPGRRDNVLARRCPDRSLCPGVFRRRPTDLAGFMPPRSWT